jgi:DNA (cytosine-5)-methyltransferase 1
VGAKTIIDWRIEATRIGEREKPLADKTRARIKTGLERLATTRPVTVQVGGNLYERPGYARVWSVDDPLRTVVGTPYMGLVTPAGSQEAAARSLEEPSHTVTGSDRLAAVLRVGGQPPSPKSADEPMSTVTAHDRQVGLILPVGGQTGAARRVRDTEEPLTTVTTDNHRMLVQVNRSGEGEENRLPRSVDEPTRTVAGHGEMALVELRNHGTARSAEMPAHTVVGGGLHHGMLVYNGVPGFVRPLEDAAGTVTSRDKQSLLVPYYTKERAHSTSEPMATVSTKDREALLITEDDIDACLFRMLQWEELLRAQMMHTLPGGAPYRLTARRRGRNGQMRELSNELRVKMIGNAVSSPVATMLGNALMEILR